MTSPASSRPAESERVAILVLGMHRSGTSALTRVLNLLGVELGDRLLPAHADNEAGFWEHREVVAVHDRLLEALGSTWDDPAPLPAEALLGETARPFREELAAIVARDFGAAPLWGLKDPRLCRLLPLWRSILEETGGEPRVVVTSREPSDVVASLARRNGFEPEKSRLLWLEHCLRAERDSRGLRRAFVTYEQLMTDWRSVVSRLDRELGLGASSRLDAAAPEIDAFLDPALRHHAAGAPASDPNDWIAAAHREIVRAAAGEAPLDESKLDGIRGTFEAAGSLFFPWSAGLRESIRARDARIARLRAKREAGPKTPVSGPDSAAVDAPSPEADPLLARSGTTIVRDYATPVGAPRVSIVIPLYDKADLTRKCLESLAEHTPEGLYEVVLVDNGSTDGTAALLECLEGNVKIVRNEENLGFATACNQGARIATTDRLLFLNNDIEAKPGWLEPLLGTLDVDPDVAAVGSKLLFPDGTIQHAGVALLSNPFGETPLGAFHVHYGEPADFPDAIRPQEYQVLTGACLLVRREQFEAVGGFDRYFWNGCEDIDLCLKIRARGGKLVYRPESELVHHESMSGPERFSRVRANEKLLCSRWFGKVEPDMVCDEQGNRVLTSALGIRPWAPPAGAPGPGPAAKAPTAGDGGHGPAELLTSIVVLTRNSLADTRACLDSIARHTPERHEVVVVDNGSTDDTLEYLGDLVRRRENVRVVSNADNRGFGAGNNQGLSIARGRYLVLLNNDTVVTEGWLGGLLGVLDDHPECGLVGPMTNRASGPQVVPDVPYSGVEGLDRFARTRARDWRGRSDSVRRLVGFCWLMRREVVDAIGGFDERFVLGNCEDDDFCLRAHQAGWRARIASDVFVHHTGSRTFAAEKIDYDALMRRNFERFREKWGLDPAIGLEDGYPIRELAEGPKQPPCPLPDLAIDHRATLGGRLLEPLGRTAGSAPARTAPAPAAPAADASAAAPADPARRLKVGVLPGREPADELRELFRRYGHRDEIPIWSEPGHLAAQFPDAEFVLLLGPDVVLDEEAISRLVRIAVANPEIAAVGPASNAAPAPQRAKAGYTDRKRGLKRFTVRRARRYGDSWERVPHLGAFCVLLRTDAIREVGGLAAGGTIADALWDLWVRLGAAGKAVAVAPGAWVHHSRLDPEEGADYDERAARTGPAAVEAAGAPARA